MKIIVIGAAGTIGQAVVKELASRHEVISAGRNSGDIRVDLTDVASIEAMYQQVGPVDAIVSAAGNAHFGALAEMGAAEFAIGINDKLMGQVQLVLIGQKYLNDGGSFTLISGALTHDPIVYGSGVSMVNGGLEAFARAAAIELPRGLRINVVSPTVLTESLPSYGPYFRGFESVASEKVGRAFSKSVEGAQTGQIYQVL